MVLGLRSIDAPRVFRPACRDGGFTGVVSQNAYLDRMAGCWCDVAVSARNPASAEADDCRGLRLRAKGRSPKPGAFMGSNRASSVATHTT